MTLAILLVAAYLLGSVPFGYLVGRTRGVDVTKHGSGNTSSPMFSRGRFRSIWAGSGCLH
jgi:glycerol-3-phosphate acyltransferase PlsY